MSSDDSACDSGIVVSETVHTFGDVDVENSTNCGLGDQKVEKRKVGIKKPSSIKKVALLTFAEDGYDLALKVIEIFRSAGIGVLMLDRNKGCTYYKNKVH